MVFTGRPSAGCITCKQRKKKCDLTKPFCQQCKKANRACPGVPNRVDLLFRNNYCNGQIEPVKQPHTITTVNKEPSVISNNKSRRTQRQASCQIAPSIPVDWPSMATNYYFDQHCYSYFVNIHSLGESRMKGLNPWLELQSGFFTVPESGTALDHAVQALAMLTMATDLQLPNLAQKAYTAYGRGLRAINVALSDRNIENEYNVALAVHAMTSFELKQRGPSCFQRYDAHCSGMKKLLALGGREQLQNKESLTVFRALRVQVICDHMMRHEALKLHADNSIWTEVHAQDYTPTDSLWNIAARIPELLAKTDCCRRSSSTQIFALLSDAIQLDLDLVNWLSLHQEALQTRFMIKKDHSANFWHDTVYVYTNLSTATLLNQYYSMRVQVLNALTKIVDEADDDSVAIALGPMNVRLQIQELADNLCYSLPFVTGQVRGQSQPESFLQARAWAYPSHGEATWILMPIATMAHLELIGTVQRAWLRQKLNSLNADFRLIDSIPAFHKHVNTGSPLPQDFLRLT